MNCPKCQHEHFVKNGFVNEKQRYKCKDCNYQWTEHHTHRGRPLAETRTRRLSLLPRTFHECHRQNPSRLTQHYSPVDTRLRKPTRTTP